VKLLRPSKIPERSDGDGEFVASDIWGYRKRHETFETQHLGSRRKLRPPGSFLEVHVGNFSAHRPGVIVTAHRDRAYDFVSRYFAPAKRIPEDPVSGAAHCILSPYWASGWARPRLRLFRHRGAAGRSCADWPEIAWSWKGRCVFYLEGEVEFQRPAIRGLQAGALNGSTAGEGGRR
jgi:hypothetical protein